VRILFAVCLSESLLEDVDMMWDTCDEHLARYAKCKDVCTYGTVQQLKWHIYNQSFFSELSSIPSKASASPPLASAAEGA
jgi:hypothetical protein